MPVAGAICFFNLKNNLKYKHIMENDLLYVSLDKYYKDKDKSKYLLKYLKYEKI